MSRRALVLSVLVVLAAVFPGAAFSGTAVATAGDIYVDGSTGSGDGSQSNPYETIQTAVNDANSGDTIIVESGTYSESVNVDKSVTLRANGTVTLDGSSIDDFGFEITSDGVTIDGFTVENYRAGIEARSVTSVGINDTTVNGSDSQGITFDDVSGSVIQNSTVSESNLEGVLLKDAGSNTIRNNRIVNNIQNTSAVENRQFTSAGGKTPTDLILVIDDSGSMSTNDVDGAGSRMDAAKEAAKDAVATLDDNDRAALINMVPAVATKQSLTTDHDAANSSIDDLSASGGADMQAGINESYDELARNVRTDSKRGVIVLGDGDAAGKDVSDDLKKDFNTSIQTIALGEDVTSGNQDKLKHIAGETANTQDPEGNFIETTKLSELSGVFADFTSSAQSAQFGGIRALNSTAKDNMIYNNFLNNSENVVISSAGSNNWNVTERSEENIVGGPDIGGNFYANPSGTGPSQTGSDSDNDFFRDSSLEHGANNVDSKPLIRPPVDVTAVAASSPVANELKVTVDTDQQLTDLTVDISGQESDTRSLSDFTETENADATYTYTDTTTGRSAGDYTVEVTKATGPNGDDGSDGESDTVTVSDGPEVSSITRASPTSQATNATTVDFDVIFDVSVSGVNTADFDAKQVSGDVTGTVSDVTGSGSDYTVTVDNVQGDGTLRLDLDDDDSITSNTSGAKLGGSGTSGSDDGSYTSGEAYTIDNTAPSLTDDSGSTDEETAGTIVADLLSNDNEPTALTVTKVKGSAGNVGTAVTGSNNGKFTIDSAGQVDFDPNGAFESLASTASDTTQVMVTVADDAGNTDTQTVTATVTGVNGGGGGDDDDDDDDTSSSTSTPVQTETPTSTATLTQTETPTSTATPTQTETPTSTATPTQTETPTSTSTPVRTDTPTSTSTSPSDGTASASSDDQQRPSGETSEDEEFVDSSEISDIEIVDVRLETAPANSVNATSIITLENPSTENQTVDVRFVIDGEVVEQREVVVPAEQRINATHSEIVEKPGMHEVASNLATEEDGETVRTFDFRIGTVELNENGEEVASSSAEPPSGPDQVDATDGQQSDAGGVTLAPVLLGLVAVVAVILGALWRRRTD